MGRVVKWILILLVLILGLFLAVLNAENVRFNYYVGQVDLPFAAALVAALAIGAALGVASTVGVLVKKQYAASRLKRELRACQKELANLRSIPIKD